MHCLQRGWKYDDQFLSCIERRKELMPVLAIMYEYYMKVRRYGSFFGVSNLISQEQAQQYE